MNLDPYLIASEPYYQPLGNEIEAFKAAYAERLPVMLKGPTGLRQDPLCRAHGLAPRQAADHGRRA